MHFHLNTTSAKGDMNASNEILQCLSVSMYSLHIFGQEHKSEFNGQDMMMLEWQNK